MGNDATASPHVLYRFYDTAGALLYIGITLNPGERWKRHRDEKPWWTEVANITLQQHGSREAVLAAERAAIETETPRYNVVHNRPKAGHRRISRAAAPPPASSWGRHLGDPPPPHLSRYSLGPWEYRAKDSHHWHSGPLYLTYEISCEPCIDDCESDDGNEQARYLRRYLHRADRDFVQPTISWFVETPHGLEVAPACAPNHHPDDETWEDCLTVPFSAAYGDVDWRQLDVVHDRFPAFDAALNWRPPPFAATCPFDYLVGPVW